MHVEIKMCLDDTPDYLKLCEALQPKFIAEESYRDYFFDFPSLQLTETNSVLRLRVPCVKPLSVASPAAPGPSTVAPPGATALNGSGGGGGVFPSGAPVGSTDASQYEAYLNSWSETSVLDERLQYLQTAHQRHNNAGGGGGGTAGLQDDPNTTAAGGAAAGGGGSQPEALPQSTSGLLKGKPGKLVFKQKNTVENGHQMNFVIEDKQVPTEVLLELLAGRTNPYAVLEVYAARVNDPESPVARICERLQALADAEFATAAANAANNANANNNGSGGDGGDESSAAFSQLRYASAGVGPGRGDGGNGGGGGTHAPVSLISMGSYISTRRTYHYLEGSTTQPGSAELAPVLAASAEEEAVLRGALRIRVDRTQYPFGEKYELEVPQVGLPLDDVFEELRHFLQAAGVRYLLGSEGKYNRFITGMRSLRVQAVDVQDVKLRLTNVNGYCEVRANLDAIASEVQQTYEAGQPGARAQGVSNTLVDNTVVGVDGAPLSQQPKDGGASVGPSQATGGGGGGGSSQERQHAGSANGSQKPPLCVQEWQKNFFFDTPDEALAQQRCFLRLRESTFGHSARKVYKLVLKEKQDFSGGHQASRTSKAEVSQDVAQQLLQSPTDFLYAQHGHNAVAAVLWDSFGLRELHRTAFFATERLSVPWVSARTQVATDLTSGGGTQSGAGEGPAVPPLRLHLDRTLYTVHGAAISLLPSQSQQQHQQQAAQAAGLTQQPIESNPETGEHTFELYELEVTDLLPSTSPSAVMEELTAVLRQMGVEWQTGVQSKLQQYWALANAVRAIAESRAYDINRGFSQYKRTV